jgi:hypothetical protein
MFKVVAASLFSALVGGLTVCAVLDAPPPPPPSPELASAELSRAARAQLDALSARLDAIERQLAQQAVPPLPARTVVEPPVEVDALVARVDKLTDDLAMLQKNEAFTKTPVVEEWSRFKRMQPAEALLDALANAVQADTDPLRMELAARRKALPKDDAPALVQLAEWAESQGLKIDAKRLLRAAVKVDPNNREARERLGYGPVEFQTHTGLKLGDPGSVGSDR